MRRPWHELSAADAARLLGADPARGLGDAAASRRLAADGPNALLEESRRTKAALLRAQLSSAMIWLLVAAAALSAALGDAVDAAVIGCILVLNVMLGFVQEYRADRSLAALKRLDVPRAKAIREGRLRELPPAELVRGDLVVLEAGARVPADGRLVQAAGLRIEEASLTGESEPALKEEGPIRADALGDRRNMAYLGTTVLAGRGLALVTETGMRTELGRIAASLQAVAEGPTPLQRRLEKTARALAWTSMGVVLAFFAVGVWRGEPMKLMLLTSVSMAVAAVPEGLPVVITATLAIAARRMLGRKALIRKLAAVEALGSVTVICSDKTGTLTQNVMKTAALEPAEGAPAARLLAALALCGDAVSVAGREHAVGDPTETALVDAALAAGLSKAALEKLLPRVAETPFDSGRKRMSTVHSVERAALEGAGPESAAARELLGPDGGAFLVLAKGSTESLLKVCTRVWDDGGLRPLTEEDRGKIKADDDRLSGAGMRVIAGAFRRLGEAPSGGDLERELVFLGKAGLSDPARPEARRAVASCISAGIRPVMITGDHPLTAKAIAHAVGIGDGSSVMTGAEAAALTPEEMLLRVADVSIFARVAPEHKLKIVGALQARGEVVAMTGDGVNDAPALRKADIGVAMGVTGTDVAKEAASMVLLDDNFATIVAAVKEGRVVYDNIRKFLKFLMTTNAAELALMLAAPALGMPLPLTPLQILWVNLVTDGLPALALGFEPAESDVMRRPPRAPHEPLFTRDLVRHIVWAGLLMAGLALFAGYRSWSAGHEQWRSVLLLTLVLTQMGHALAIRTDRQSVFGSRPNAALLGAVAATGAMQLALLYAPPLQRLFGTSPPSPLELATAGAAALAVFGAVELEKAVRRRRASGRGVAAGGS